MTPGRWRYGAHLLSDNSRSWTSLSYAWPISFGSFRGPLHALQRCCLSLPLRVWHPPISASKNRNNSCGTISFISRSTNFLREGYERIKDVRCLPGSCERASANRNHTIRGAFLNIEPVQELDRKWLLYAWSTIASDPHAHASLPFGTAHFMKTTQPDSAASARPHELHHWAHRFKGLEKVGSGDLTASQTLRTLKLSRAARRMVRAWVY